MRHNCLIAAISMLALAALLPTASAAPARTEYTVVREGSEIGRHVIEIERQGDATTVKISTNVVVKVAFIPVYRFEQSSNESWKANRLLTLQSQTNDDGKMHTLSVSREADHLNIAADGRPARGDQALLPASLWHVGTISQSTLLNTVTGAIMRVRITDKGENPVNTGHGQISARHYQLSGELERELWYDRAGNLVRLELKGSDGSAVAYVMK